MIFRSEDGSFVRYDYV